jgi:ribosomal protein L37AE/L43A
MIPQAAFNKLQYMVICDSNVQYIQEQQRNKPLCKMGRLTTMERPNSCSIPASWTCFREQIQTTESLASTPSQTSALMALFVHCQWTEALASEHNPNTEMSLIQRITPEQRPASKDCKEPTAQRVYLGTCACTGCCRVLGLSSARPARIAISVSYDWRWQQKVPLPADESTLRGGGQAGRWFTFAG